jgi:hypothetical protein
MVKFKPSQSDDISGPEGGGRRGRVGGAGLEGGLGTELVLSY